MKRLSHILFILFFTMAISSSISLAQNPNDTSTLSINVFSWLQGGYFNYNLEKKGSSFKFSQSQFGINLSARDKLRCQLIIDGVYTMSAPRVYQAWVEYEFHSMANLRVGQFKYPFGLEAYPDFILWKFIEPSYATDAMIKELGLTNSGDNSGYYCDIGMQLLGRYDINDNFAAKYQAMIFNGNGILKSDNNQTKDWVIRAQLLAPYGTHLGVAYYKGRFMNEHYNRNFSENAIGFEFKMENLLANKIYRLQGEYITTENETIYDNVKHKGYYIYGSYFIYENHLETALRYSHYNPSPGHNTASKRRISTLGLTWYFNSDQLIRINADAIENYFTPTIFSLEIVLQIALHK